MEDLLGLIGGLGMDACLRTLNVKVNKTRVNWGFSYENNPFLAMIASLMIGMMLYHYSSIQLVVLFGAIFCICVCLMIISYADYEEFKKESDILDDDFRTKR